MPLWVTVLIKLALKFGLPWLEAHVPPAIAAIIEAILKIIQEHPQGQLAGMEAVNETLKDKFPGFFEPSDVLKD